ncbi:uncharacterized protein J7T54_008310 [Emericellopsis cladophorae]|uniref:Uncharacterized protein n=1 Tax=Emericellopsis cladophorae TaxID=2686198 RepID=A0A9P9XUD5_9HYPO|nr:uncharacterized protein J7T54_008310 [Emericellopsis cladophorae]KAI6777976.1 hypothetical protein J7T54_008310 [Emericellopsis cladophorae]
MQVSIMLSLTVWRALASASLKLRIALILYCADRASYRSPKSPPPTQRDKPRQAASKMQARKPASLAAFRIQYGTMNCWSRSAEALKGVGVCCAEAAGETMTANDAIRLMILIQ